MQTTDAQTLVLCALADGPQHGYAINVAIEQLTGRRLGVGSLYGALGPARGEGSRRRAERAGPSASRPTHRGRTRGARTRAAIDGAHRAGRSAKPRDRPDMSMVDRLVRLYPRPFQAQWGADIRASTYERTTCRAWRSESSTCGCIRPSGPPTLGSDGSTGCASTAVALAMASWLLSHLLVETDGHLVADATREAGLATSAVAIATRRRTRRTMAARRRSHGPLARRPSRPSD